MVFIWKKSRAGANTKSPSITHPGTDIHELHTPSQTVFTQEQNELFVQQVFQYSQVIDGAELHYHVLGLNESSTEDDMKKAYDTLDRWFHPGKNKHSQFSDVTKMIKESKE